MPTKYSKPLHLQHHPQSVDIYSPQFIGVNGKLHDLNRKIDGFRFNDFPSLKPVHGESIKF